jgi:hypothetical protein
MIGSAIKDLGGAVDNLANALGKDVKNPYPETNPTVVNQVDENAGDWRKSVGYGFRVVRVSQTGRIYPIDGWQDFVLQINPQELSQDEIFAIEVTPTFSGVIVEHQGVTLKDINISGTVGNSPNRRGGGAYPQNGRPAAAAGRSGFFEFHQLRNYIRTYVEQKRVGPKDPILGELRLIWDNFKDNEAIFVEPQKFTMKRSASRPFMYDYNIELKGIGLADAKLFPDDAWFDNIDSALETADQLLTAAVKVLQASVSFIERVETDVVGSVIRPLQRVGEFMRDFKAAGGRVTRVRERLQKLQVRAIYEKVADVNDNLNDFMNKETETYNAAKGRIRTFGFNAQVKSIEATKERALNALNNAKKALDALLKDNEPFKEGSDEAIAADHAAYNDAARVRQANAAAQGIREKKNRVSQLLIEGKTKEAQALREELETEQNEINSNSGAANNKLAIPRAQTFELVDIKGGDNIQTIAARELGDPDRYRELVIVNNLKWPYVDSTNRLSDIAEGERVPGILYPGQKIKIPRQGEVERLAFRDNDIYPITKDLDLVERNFGVDFKLTDDFDIAVSSVGDAKLIAGSKNVAQAILIKILLETNSLKRHPNIGTSLSIGEKTTNLAVIADQIRTSLVADRRIENVIFSSVEREGGTTKIKLILKLKGVDHPIDAEIPA